MTNTMALFEAECGACGQVFACPLLSDFSYGEIIFCTVDGKTYLTANAFTDFSKRVAGLVKAAGTKGKFWSTLASLADPVGGKALSVGTRCPNCFSTNLASYGSTKKVGVAEIGEATFAVTSALSPSALAEKIKAVLAASGA